MDRQKLRNLVFEKTGIKVDSDDPIFALVALNDAVLADTVERHVALLTAAAHELALQARGPERHPASHPAHPGPSAGAPPFAPAPAAAVKPIPTAAALFEPRELRLLGAAAGLSLLAAALVLGGQALLTRPAPAPLAAPAVMPAALTAQQAQAIERGEKLARAVQKLDPKSRALIQSEMQKP